MQIFKKIQEMKKNKKINKQIQKVNNFTLIINYNLIYFKNK